MRTPSLGATLPWMIGLLVATDLTLRFLPSEWFAFRPQEALARYRMAEGPYEPNRSAAFTHSYGDLAAIGNLAQLRHYHAERTTSDRYGYRNPPELAAKSQVDTILVGDSYSLGVSLNDHETLAAQIGRQSGRVVYNMGSQPQVASWAQVRAMIGRLHVRHGLVIYEFLGRFDPPAPGDGEGATDDPDASTRLLVRLEGLWLYSPSRILAERAFRRLQDGRILPNPYAERVREHRLRNGTPILFLAEDVDKFYLPRWASAQYWIWLAGELRKLDMDLLVLLLPDKFSVHYPLLADARPAAIDPNPYLARIERELRAARIHVINLTPLLRDEAVKHFRQGRYIYWLDDTHWNAEGVRIVAREIASSFHR